VLELGAKLGPVLWQLPASKRFEPEDFAAFLALLPRERDGRAIRHAIEAPHASFRAAEFVALMRKFSAAIAFIDSPERALLADVTSDFLYLRLQRTAQEIATGYPPDALAAWAGRARTWAQGGAACDLPMLAPAAGSKSKRDVFIYMISGAKVRAPAAAMALIEALK
jgi:uncharacterized protein YecE (DUF72 family)